MSKSKNLRKAFNDDYLDDTDPLDDYPRDDRTENCNVYRGKKVGRQRSDY